MCTQTPSIQSVADFLAFTNNIDFGNFADAVFVVDGEITGTFKDATPVAASTPTTSIN